MTKVDVQRDMSVVGKGLKGKHNTPYVTLKSSDGEKLQIHFPDKSYLNKYTIGKLLTVKVVPEQSTL